MYSSSFFPTLQTHSRKIFCFINIFPQKLFKGALSGLRQHLEPENPLKIMKHAFYFILKALFVLRYLNFCLDFLVM